MKILVNMGKTSIILRTTMSRVANIRKRTAVKLKDKPTMDMARYAAPV